jgi:hypothetical protein
MAAKTSAIRICQCSANFIFLPFEIELLEIS